jgi:RND family efflux transporter MFP subunit
MSSMHPPARTVSKFTRLVVLSTFAAFAAAACGTGDQSASAESAGVDADSAAQQPPAVPVAVATVGAAGEAVAVEATGTYASRDEIALAFKIGGVVRDVRVDQGATVKRGQLLASLDLREIDAQVSKAHVAVDKAERDVARLARLAADSVATTSQLQDATSARDAASADLRSAQVNREYALITAPEDGIVLSRAATAGTTVAPGVPQFTLGGARRGRVLRVGLPDHDALRVRTGDRATVAFDALRGRSALTGRVVLVSQSADPRTGTYAVEIALEGANALPSGLVGRARITTRERSASDAVPVDALIEADRDSATVFVVDGPSTIGRTTTARAVRVRVGELRGDRAEVSGLTAGTPVITRGAPYVTAGARVKIVAPER